MARPLIITSLVVLATAIAGCGQASRPAAAGEAPLDGAPVQRAVAAYTVAATRGDGRRACALLTPAQRRRIDLTAGGELGPCETVIAARARAFRVDLAGAGKGHLLPGMIERMRPDRVLVRFSGPDWAMAAWRQETGPSRSRVVLVRGDGGWRVSAFAPAA